MDARGFHLHEFEKVGTIWFDCLYLGGLLVAVGLCAGSRCCGGFPLSIEGNLVGYIDRHCLPGKLICGNFDPEGLLSTLPAIVTALLGIYAGKSSVPPAWEAERERVCFCRESGLCWSP